MAILQSNSGSEANGTSAFTVSLPGAAVGTSAVVITVFGNTTVNTPAGFTSRSPQVDVAGHYLFDGPGGASSWNLTTGAPGHLSWHVYEISNGVYDTSAGSETGTGTEYATPTITPTAGERELIATIGAVDLTATRTLSGWTNSYVEAFETSSTNGSNEFSSQGGATRNVTADGVTGYTTTATFSAAANLARSAIGAAYATSATVPPRPWRATTVVRPPEHPNWRAPGAQFVTAGPVLVTVNPPELGTSTAGLVGRSTPKKVAVLGGRAGMGLSGTRYSAAPPPPGGFTHVTVTRDYDLATGAPPVGVVYFTPSEWLVNSAVTVVGAAVPAVLDAEGRISISLVANTNPGTVPTDSFYTVRESITGQPDRSYGVVIRHDSGATIDLATLPVLD